VTEVDGKDPELIVNPGYVFNGPTIADILIY